MSLTDLRSGEPYLYFPNRVAFSSRLLWPRMSVAFAPVVMGWGGGWRILE